MTKCKQDIIEDAFNHDELINNWLNQSLNEKLAKIRREVKKMKFCGCEIIDKEAVIELIDKEVKK